MRDVLRSRPFARPRPGALPVPARQDVSALTSPQVFDRWSADAAGIRPSALELGDNAITMFDVIGEDYWSGGGVTAKKVAAQLRAIGDRAVEVQINSPGGDMFEGLAIYNVLREHPQRIRSIRLLVAEAIPYASWKLDDGSARTGLHIFVTDDADSTWVLPVSRSEAADVIAGLAARCPLASVET